MAVRIAGKGISVRTVIIANWMVGRSVDVVGVSVPVSGRRIIAADVVRVRVASPVDHIIVASVVVAVWHLQGCGVMIDNVV